MYRGVLYSPAGRGFEPYQLTYLGNYLWMAKQWLKDRINAKTLKPSTDEPSVRGEARGATAPSGSRLHQRPVYRETNVVSLQEKTYHQLSLGISTKIRRIGEAANDVIASEVQ